MPNKSLTQADLERSYAAEAAGHKVSRKEGKSIVSRIDNDLLVLWTKLTIEDKTGELSKIPSNQISIEHLKQARDMVSDTATQEKLHGFITEAESALAGRVIYTAPIADKDKHAKKP